jgi:hypothetical protein
MFVQHVLITLEIERRLPLRLRKSWANVHVFNALDVDLRQCHS